MKQIHTEEKRVSFAEEMKAADFGNLHLTKRYGRMLDAIMQCPGDSFPDIFNTEADLEGAYRFLRNPNVTWHKAIASHLNATVIRAQVAGKILAIHDTTDFTFPGEEPREGLGFVNQTTCRGFFGHFAFAVSGDSSRTPLGIVGVETYSRKGKPKRNPSHRSFQDPNRESLRWGRLVSDVQSRLNSHTEVIHVMDREADIYGLLDELCFNNQRFVIRLCYDRALKDLPGTKVSDALQDLKVVCEREVVLSRRAKNRCNKKENKTHPPRERRTARLAFSATTVEIKRPHHHNVTHTKALRLNVIHVEELDPPNAEQKVEWKLITTEPIQTTEEITEVVDIYRSRWLIEEYFKVLKTGCNYEKRQLESLQTLLNALALFVPVAHRLLLLRNLSRTTPQLPADCVLTKIQIEILLCLPKSKLAHAPSVRDALFEIARLGGHIKNNGDPGWLTIWRGYRKLLLYEVAWSAKK